MRLPLFVARQARRPHGWLGKIVAKLMENQTAHVNDRAIEMLDVQPTDHVLDIGTGHGRSLGEFAALANKGRITGLDYSDVMLRRAAKRNDALIRAGRIRLQQGASDAMPFADASFDKAMAVHTLYFWDPAEPHLTEIARVLRPGGCFVLAFHPSDDPTTATYPTAVYRFRSEDEVTDLVRHAGFDCVAASRVSGRDGITALHLWQRKGTGE